MDDGNDAIPQKISHNIKKQSTLKMLYVAGRAFVDMNSIFYYCIDIRVFYVLAINIDTQSTES